MALYHVTSLEQIAELFERRADDYRKKSLRATSQKDRRWQEAQSFTWRMAADFLRNTKLVPPDTTT
jgi:hypothetical protein